MIKFPLGGRPKYRATHVWVCPVCDAYLFTKPVKSFCANGHKVIHFASKVEAKWYRAYKQDEKQGRISELKTQPKYDIAVNGIHICFYYADFSYVRDGRTHVIDVKGLDTPLSALKRLLVRAIHGVTVELVH